VADDAFFRARKAAAVLKHGVVSRYVLPFATKVGSTSVGNRVVVLDGYAGEGRYEDGTPGSPIFFAEAARKLAPSRTLDLIFIEEKKARYEKLCKVLAQEATDLGYEVWYGSVGDHLDDVLTRAAGVPFFAFLDPCGVGLPFTDIAERIFGRPDYQYAPATEVLLNFSAEAVRRIGGRLREQENAPGRAATLARMDAACGGDWWRGVYRDAESPEQANERIASGFASRLREATGTGSWVIEVRNAEHQQPKYALVFLSRHPDGLYLYGNAMSTSQHEWRRAVVPPGSLLDDDDAFKAAEREMEEQWIKEIAANIEHLVQTHPSFTISSKYGEVMSGTLGRAGETHIRSALKRLQEAGVLSSDCVGVRKLHNHAVTRA
jgi:three-Cys-motif partner protein